MERVAGVAGMLHQPTASFHSPSLPSPKTTFYSPSLREFRLFEDGTLWLANCAYTLSNFDVSKIYMILA
jgi:hypothetical protein